MAQTKKSRGLIRSLNRSAVRDDKSPRVVRKTPAPADATVCARCGAIYVRKSWRHDHKLTDEQISRHNFGFCPACQQMARREGEGRVQIRGTEIARDLDAIERRIFNAAESAARTQPERRVVSIEAMDSGGGLDLITTSQKLAHRIAHEIKKAFGGRATYAWSDDGTLFAVVDLDARRV